MSGETVERAAIDQTIREKFGHPMPLGMFNWIMESLATVDSIGKWTLRSC
jgi:hypothetical protein